MGQEQQLISTDVITQQSGLWDAQHRKRAAEHQEIFNTPNQFATECIAYLPKGATILELGPGNGRDARYMASAVDGYAVAVDFAPSALRQLVEQSEVLGMGQFVAPVLADMRSFPFGGESTIDAFYARSAVHLTDDELDHFLQEHIIPMLVPGGYIMIEGKNEGDYDMQQSTPLGGNLWVDKEKHVRRLWNDVLVREMVAKHNLDLVRLSSHDEIYRKPAIEGLEIVADRRSSFTSVIARKPIVL